MIDPPGSDGMVAVVIPAYNAAATLDRTLRSVRVQTHRRLDIVVVDDGSSDESAAIVRGHAAEDGRVRLLQQANAGVAAARNAGLAATVADYVAMVDADDLWAPDAAASLLAAIRGGGADTGLAYCGFGVIDAHDRVERIVTPSDAGDVRHAVALRNIVGNGSGAMFRRAAIEQAGGYDSSLRAKDAQGCEDHLLYFRVGLRWRFACVPSPLLGYRIMGGSMSQNYGRMLRSHALCVAQFQAAMPDMADAIARSHIDFAGWLMTRAIEYGPLSAAPGLAMKARRMGVARLARLAVTAGRRRIRRGWPKRHFADVVRS
jgi:hypothetical protein